MCQSVKTQINIKSPLTISVACWLQVIGVFPNNVRVNYKEMRCKKMHNVSTKFPVRCSGANIT